MADQVQPPETDLVVPLPGDGDVWDPHTIHTHFLPFCVPEAKMGVFAYIRYHPYFPLGQGGVLVFQGLDNLVASDMTFMDYEMTMAWPTIDGNTFTLPTGLRFEFVEPGRRVLISYRSADGECVIDVEANAVTPLAARGHVMPGEELHRTAEPGGSEQFMHYTGEITVRGKRHAVDCHYIRDRSWRQVRRESRDANRHPPITWTPVYFDEGFAFNQIGMEAHGAPSIADGAYDLSPDTPRHHFAWVSRDGEVRDVTRVERVVTRHHPLLGAPLAMEIEAEDERGDVYHLRGEAIAMSPIPTWPNLTAFDSVFRWEDGEGRVGHGSAQTAWNERVQHAFKARRGTSA